MKEESKRKELLKTILIAFAALALLCGVYFAFFQERDTKASDHFTTEEKRLVLLLKEMEGVGKVSVAVNTKGEEVCVVVVCEGANDLLVRSELLRVVALATGADRQNILIYKMSE